MPARTLLFDLDGTLVDSLADIAASANHVRGVAGLAPVDLDRARTMVGDGARKLVERAIAGNPRGFGPDDVWGDYLAHHEVQCTGTVALYPGVEEFLDRELAAGTRMAIVTNKPERFARRISAHLGLDRWMAVLVGGDTTSERKPSPAPLRHALDALGSRTPATMIGDGPQDIRAGKAAGLRTIGVLFGFHEPATLHAENADEYWIRFGESV
ncbi:MAG: HAD-IA family hydrolase [Planctomycetes bacterium]|nr:HAD-IA family hydrolase [Planctomycetota bacterium]